jgi:hypothetical protein
LTVKLKGFSSVARSKKPTPSETPDATDETPGVAGDEATADRDAATGDQTTGEGTDDGHAGTASDDKLPGDEGKKQAGPDDAEAESLALTEKAEEPVGQPDDAEVSPPPQEDMTPAAADDETPPDPDEPRATAPVPRDPPPAPPARGSAIPLFLGGVAAAALGFVVARYAVPEGWPTPDPAPPAGLSATVEDQAAQIAGLEARLAEVAATLADLSGRSEPDLSAVREELRAELLSAIPAAPDLSEVEDLQTRIAELSDEIARLADSPVDQGPSLTDDELAAFRTELDSAVSEARSQIEAAQAEAARVEAEAQAAASRATAEAALSRIAAALDSGAAYGAALTEVSEAGTEIPAVLAEGADGGVPTLPALQDAFPDAARSALDASILATDTDSTVDRALAFLRVQTGARSLTPREGDDPDAILSRAEAAVRAGDLETALSEVASLPEQGAAAMSDWTAAAEARQAALTALTELRAQIETN